MYALNNVCTNNIVRHDVPNNVKNVKNVFQGGNECLIVCDILISYFYNNQGDSSDSLLFCLSWLDYI